MAKSIVDGNTAAAHVAYAFSEVAVIYPITPSSSMAELSDIWSSKNKKNVFGDVVDVVEMQSEAGVAGALHGVLSSGTLATTFTSSQGLLLMIPNMYKISGELLPTVFHVAARSLATQSLSIFGDHSDVMSVRQTGFAMMAASNVQEVHDLAVIAHLSSLSSRIPFLNFFDGFRTSHEIAKVDLANYDDLHSLVDKKAIDSFRKLALDPSNPKSKVGAQNPDVYFQGRETVNKFYLELPGIIKNNLSLFEKKFKRNYSFFEYTGHKDAKDVIVCMGSGADTVFETVNYLVSKGKKVGAVKVRLYRPFVVDEFKSILPSSVKRIAVLDRTKEPGSIGEPLYLDVCAALQNSKIKIIGGRYGLSSKEFNPAMVTSVFTHLSKACTHNFTVGINDDVTHLSLKFDPDFDIVESSFNCKFWGLGSDGTVGSVKQLLDIVGDKKFVQGYFGYDAKKCGGVTQSYVRISDSVINSPYLPTSYDFIVVNNNSFIVRYDLFSGIKEGGVVLINSPLSKDEVFSSFTKDQQTLLLKKNVKLYTINAFDIADKAGISGKVGTAMLAAFFKLYNRDANNTISRLKQDISSKWGKKSEDLVKMNYACIDAVNSSDLPLLVPVIKTSKHSVQNVCLSTNNFVNNSLCPILKLKGDSIPVSAMPVDGSIPTGTSKFEKRNIATEVPKWVPANCIQCARCSFVCPHSSIRVKQFDPTSLKDVPKDFAVVDSFSKSANKLKYRVQVYPEDCVGCGICVKECPAKNKALVMVPNVNMESEIKNAEFFDKINCITEGTQINTVKGSQFRQPLFEFSGACIGCGETPYLKLLTQLFGENLVVANATGCTSVYSGTFPSIPYTVNKDGKGPAWANSLFEDNAEYAFGMRLGFDKKKKDVNLWAIGGDGWAYDIGFSGIDHVCSQRRKVNILVLDTEVYSNTGGQQSKATPIGAVAKFAASGKYLPKKNLGLMMLSYGYVYVASVNMAFKEHLIKALIEASEYDGPSLVIAYAPCNEHGVDLSLSQDQCRKAVECGYWPLYRYHPLNGFSWDSPEKKISFEDYIKDQIRYTSLKLSSPDQAKKLLDLAIEDIKRKEEQLKSYIKKD